MAQYYDRYKSFKINTGIEPIPGIIIPQSNTDKSVVYKKGQSRLDKISNDYYNNPYSGWMIMQANPQFGGLEFNIPDGALIRVPYPFGEAVSRYITQVTKHKQLYG
ncbi:MAG: hypothetical protein NTX82_05275 [Candidatus Parcubacteria bacterium]|nr:hypothetical protein [Candidatus Parcubacteria bacterium]